VVSFLSLSEGTEVPPYTEVFWYRFNMTMEKIKHIQKLIRTPYEFLAHLSKGYWNPKTKIVDNHAFFRND